MHSLSGSALIAIPRDSANPGGRDGDSTIMSRAAAAVGQIFEVNPSVPFWRPGRGLGAYIDRDCGSERGWVEKYVVVARPHSQLE